MSQFVNPNVLVRGLGLRTILSPPGVADYLQVTQAPNELMT